MTAMRKYIEKYGRPCTIYTDYGAVFRVNVNNPDHIKITQFERSLLELDIKPIHATSPQAKGRVERVHSTNQDRLVWELRLANISTMEEANIFVQNVYIAKHNVQFAIKAAKTSDIHRSIDDFDLDNIFCIKTVRTLQNDYIIAYRNRFFQLDKKQPTVIGPKNEIVIYDRLNGSIELWIRKVKLSFKEIKRRPVVEQIKEFKPVKPAANHPWREYWRMGSKSSNQSKMEVIKDNP